MKSDAPLNVVYRQQAGSDRMVAEGQRYTAVEREDRINFLLLHVRGGFSRVETQRIFAKKFDCSYETARRWYNEAASTLQVVDPSERALIRDAIVELYHAQVTAAQKDILEVAADVEYVSGIINRRRELQRAIFDHQLRRKLLDRTTEAEYKKELSLLPEISYADKMQLVNAKSQMRERLFRTVTELARLQGLYRPPSNWQEAINTLLDNNLLPPAIAERMLQSIEVVNSQLSAIALEEPTNIIDEDVPN